MKTLLEKIERIEASINKSLDVLNKEILESEILAKKHMEEIERIAKKYPLMTVEIKEEYTIAKYVSDKIGIYMSPAYQKEFNSYTCRQPKRFLLWYKVRDNIYGYYGLVNAEIKADRISIKSDSDSSFPLSKDDYKDLLIKEYANGRKDLKKEETLVKIIEAVKRIHEWGIAK